MKRLILIVGLLVGVGGIAGADDAADVEAAERAFNAAQNAGNAEAMFKWMLPTRTIFGPANEHLSAGWTDQDKKQRQAGFDAAVRSTTTSARCPCASTETRPSLHSCESAQCRTPVKLRARSACTSPACGCGKRMAGDSLTGTSRFTKSDTV
jgi:hypothetical protein